MKNKELFEIRKNKIQEQHLLENEVRQIQLGKKEAVLKEYYTDIKKQSEIYKNKKDVDSLIIKKKEQEIAREKERKIQEEVRLKLPIIQERQHIAQGQFIKQYKTKEIKQIEKEKNIERINNIVQNLKVRPKVEIDPERVKRITESLKAKYETEMDTADKVVLFKNPGFTVDRLMTDLRYKVSTALNEAGLSGKQYSNDLLNNINLFLKPSN
jgi:hypothetical protein